MTKTIHIKDGRLVARVNAEIKRTGSRLKTAPMAATLIEEALAAREAVLTRAGKPAGPTYEDRIRAEGLDKPGRAAGAGRDGGEQ